MFFFCIHSLYVKCIYLGNPNLKIIDKCLDHFHRVCYLHHRNVSSIRQEEKIMFIKRLKSFKIQQQSTSTLKNAAVLVPFCKVNGELSILYTLRKLHLKTHKGQVSFPGGKQDSNDSSLEITALRETEEELGIPKSVVEIWGHGNMLIGKEFNILPVIGYLGEVDVNKLRPNLAEVEFAFTIPLHHFYDIKNCKYTQYRDGSNYVLPVFTNAKYKVWGITALITHIVLCAFSPTKYIHQLKLIKFKNGLT